MADPAPTRRARRRQETLAEITALAGEQVAQRGAEALSLTAVARAMGMAPAALYRYFASRDDLLAALVVEAYDDLADALEAARDGGLRGVARAYRAWALARPNAYRLIFSSPSGSGERLAPDRVVPAAQRGMDVLLAVLEPGPEPVPALAGQLRAWGARSGSTAPAAVLARGVTFWARLHGVVDLELGGHLAATGVDPALLLEAEVEALSPPVPSGGSARR